MGRMAIGWYSPRTPLLTTSNFSRQRQHSIRQFSLPCHFQPKNLSRLHRRMTLWHTLGHGSKETTINLMISLNKPLRSQVRLWKSQRQHNITDHRCLDYQVYNELKKDTKAEEYLQSGRQGQVDIRSGHGNPTERWLMQSSTEDPWTIYTAEGAGKKD